jgi:hypothetical protein
VGFFIDNKGNIHYKELPDSRRIMVHRSLKNRKSLCNCNTQKRRCLLKPIIKLSVAELLSLDPADVKRQLSSKEVRHIFTSLGAFWINEADWSQPHILQDSGLHCNGEIRCDRVFEYPNMLQILAQQMALLIGNELRSLYLTSADWIVSSEASRPLAAELARIYDCRQGGLSSGSGHKQIWEGQIKSTGETVPGHIESFQSVLHVEAHMINALTVNNVRVGIRGAHDGEVNFITTIPVLMHQSDVRQAQGSRILAMNHFNIGTWHPEAPVCLYCQYNSPLVESPLNNYVP